MCDLSEEVMWEAVVECNREYDGLFFYAVKTTGICCKPSCKSKTPLKRNVSFYTAYSAAIQDGYRPCKRCRPNHLQSNEAEIIASSIQIIEQEYRNDLTLSQLSLNVGVSKYHLQRLFKKNIGISPSEYITKLRINTALKLLQTQNDSITAIAHYLGYKSSAHFSSVFRHHVGCNPSSYRIGGKP
jgi:AraC family transcriptional regulator, regulatory protein of adaptative response / methylphosphotriester-DNA alkyltransferase methyltransferase